MLFAHLCFWSLHRETVHLALCLQPPTKNMLDLPACLVGEEKQGGLTGWSPHLAGVVAVNL